MNRIVELRRPSGRRQVQRQRVRADDGNVTVRQPLRCTDSQARVVPVSLGSEVGPPAETQQNHVGRFDGGCMRQKVFDLNLPPAVASAEVYYRRRTNKSVHRILVDGLSTGNEMAGSVNVRTEVDGELDVADLPELSCFDDRCIPSFQPAVSR
jgi:hypothetical protein